MALYLGIKAFLSHRRMTFELILCLLIIEIASMIAFIHWQSTLQPWPLPEAFKIQENVEMQLMKSLGIIITSSSIIGNIVVLLKNTIVRMLDALALFSKQTATLMALGTEDLRQCFHAL